MPLTFAGGTITIGESIVVTLVIREWTADVRRSLSCLMRMRHAMPISGVTSTFDFQSGY
jgi:hypothetical protein